MFLINVWFVFSLNKYPIGVKSLIYLNIHWRAHAPNTLLVARRRSPVKITESGGQLSSFNKLHRLKKKTQKEKVGEVGGQGTV